jgi:predicted DNA-binding transcriptional regulator AlpA
METTMSDKNPLPETGFLRLKQILGDPKADPPVPALIPISNSSWWDGVKKGLYPRPVKLSARTSAWRVEEIKDLIDSLSSEGAQ